MVSRISINKNTLFNYQAFQTLGIRELKKKTNTPSRELWRWDTHIKTKFINLLFKSLSSTEIYFIIERYVNTKYARHFQIKIWIFSFFSKLGHRGPPNIERRKCLRNPGLYFTLRTEETPCERNHQRPGAYKAYKMKHSAEGYIRQLGQPSQNTMGWVAQITDIFLPFWRLEVQEQGASMFRFW